MSAPTRPSLFQQVWQAYWNPAPRPNRTTPPVSESNRYHIPGTFPGMVHVETDAHENDRFELAPEHDANAIRMRLADLRSREENLNDAEAAELCDLNDAQRLQQDYEQDRLADHDVREADRLAHLRRAFASAETITGQRQTRHHGDEFNRNSQSGHTNNQGTGAPEPTEAELMATRNRLSGLRARSSQLSPEEQAELCDLNDAERLQRAIEQNKLGDHEVAEATRLAHLRKAFENNPAVRNTNRSSSTSGSSQSNDASSSRSHNSVHHHGRMPGTPMSLRQLYGRDLTRVRIQQGNNNTCYLLSGFDAIFNHPQARRILSLIQINQVRNGYMVRFPGQPEPIHVPKSALRGADNPTSNQIGVNILWAAFFRTPGAPGIQEYGETNMAMQRIFGDRVANTWVVTNTDMAISSRERDTQTAYADLWTATRRPGAHFFSLRPNPDLSFDFVNPRDNSQVEEHIVNQDELFEHKNPELTRIRLIN